MYQQPRQRRQPRYPAPTRFDRPDRGQTTILLMLVLAVGVMAMAALALVGDAMISRSRARTAADAIALASVDDAAATEQLVAWYRSRGIAIHESRGGYVRVGSGPSVAASWAAESAFTSSGDTVQAAPALVAMVARIEQYAGAPLASARIFDRTLDVSVTDAIVLRSYAGAFGLCEIMAPAGSTADHDRRFFAPC